MMMLRFRNNICATGHLDAEIHLLQIGTRMDEVDCAVDLGPPTTITFIQRKASRIQTISQNTESLSAYGDSFASYICMS